jgi:hypothetical protein
VPPLDDDPFASLSAADIATMEAATHDYNEDGSGSKYEEGEEDKEDDKWSTLSIELLLFPFWCLDAKGEKNI